MALPQAQLLTILRGIIDDPSTLHRLSQEEFDALISFVLTRLGFEVIEWKPYGTAQGQFLVRIRDPLGAETVRVVITRPFQGGEPISLYDVLYEALRLSVFSGRVPNFVFGASEFDEEFCRFVESQKQARGERGEKNFGAGATGEIILVGRKRLLELVSRFRRGLDTEAASLAHQLAHLPLTEYGRIEAPDPAQIGLAQTWGRANLPSAEQSRLVRVDALPVQVLQRILRNPRLLDDLDGREFEMLIAELLSGLGFTNVIVTPRSGDGGRDILAAKVVNDIPIQSAFECKKHSRDRTIRLTDMRALLGVVSGKGTEANIGVLVTTATFEAGCKDLIFSEARLDGKDYGELMGWIDDYKRLHPPTA